MNDIPNYLDDNAREVSSLLFKRLKIFVFRPTFVGLFTFSIFFTVILITKITTYLAVSNSIFNLNIYDVLFALIGFVMGFIIEFSLQIRRMIFK